MRGELEGNPRLTVGATDAVRMPPLPLVPAELYSVHTLLVDSKHLNWTSVRIFWQPPGGNRSFEYLPTVQCVPSFSSCSSRRSICTRSTSLEQLGSFGSGILLALRSRTVPKCASFKSVFFSHPPRKVRICNAKLMHLRGRAIGD